MSLQATTEFKWLTINTTVYKIIWFNCLEKILDKNWNKIINKKWVKTYEINLNVKCYTNEIKEFELSQEIFTFETDLNWLNIENWYNLLKTLDKFKESIDL